MEAASGQAKGEGAGGGLATEQPPPTPLDTIAPLRSAPSNGSTTGKADPYPWLHMSSPSIGTLVSRLGHSFHWTAAHPSLESLHSLRERGDAEADELLARLQPISFTADTVAVIAQRAQRHRQSNADGLNSSDSAEAAATDAACAAFLDQQATLPEWVDPSSIAMGQRVFQRSCQTCLLSLCYSSLVGGFAVPHIAAVLESTGRLTRTCPATYARLIETALMVLAVMGPDEQTLHPLWSSDGPVSAEAFGIGGTQTPTHRGNGWLAALRTRFLHAQVRSMLAKRSGDKVWDYALYGIPINQEDQLVTLLSFSFNVLRCLEQLGLPLTQAEREGYIHAWRLVGWLCGVEAELLERHMCSFEASELASQSVLLHLVYPAAEASGARMAQHVLEALTSHMPQRWSFAFHAALARLLLSDEWADGLGLPQSTPWQRWRIRLMFRQLAFAARMARWHPLLDKIVCFVNFKLPLALARLRFSHFAQKGQRSRDAVIAAASGRTPMIASERSPDAIGADEPRLITADGAGSSSSDGGGCPFLNSPSMGALATATAMMASPCSSSFIITSLAPRHGSSASSVRPSRGGDGCSFRLPLSASASIKPPRFFLVPSRWFWMHPAFAVTPLLLVCFFLAILTTL